MGTNALIIMISFYEMFLFKMKFKKNTVKIFVLVGQEKNTMMVDDNDSM